MGKFNCSYLRNWIKSSCIFSCHLLHNTKGNRRQKENWYIIMHLLNLDCLLIFGFNFWLYFSYKRRFPLDWFHPNRNETEQAGRKEGNGGLEGGGRNGYGYVRALVVVGCRKQFLDHKTRIFHHPHNHFIHPPRLLVYFLLFTLLLLLHFFHLLSLYWYVLSIAVSQLQLPFVTNFSPSRSLSCSIPLRD